MSNILGYYNNDKINVNETTDENVNMPMVFVKNPNNQSQRLLIDTPNELFYNPSTKTLHADNFSGGISSNLIAGQNLSYGTGANDNTLNLDTDLTDVNSIESETNTDLKLQSSSSNIVLKANATFNTIGKIHLARIDDDSIRFNTIEYSNQFNNSYIKFLVHYTGQGDNLVREVLKLKSNLDSEFSGNVNIAQGKTYKMNGSSLSGSNLNYSAGVTLNTKIDSKQASLTFGKLENNVPYFQEDVQTNDIIAMGSTNLMGINYSELKGLLSLNLVDNTSDLNKPISVLQQAALNGKQTILFFGKFSGFALKLEETVSSNDILVMGTSNVIGKTYSELKTLLSLNNVENIAVSGLGGNNIFFSSNKLNLNTDLINMESIASASSLDLTANDDINLLSNSDGTGSGDFVFRTNRGGGLSVVEIMRLDGATANLGIDTSPHATYKLNVSGDINIPSGSNYKIGGTNITDTTYNNGTNITIDGSNNINLNNTITNDITFNGKIKNLGGCELEVMNGGDTNTNNGIYLWTNTDSNFGIYMARSGGNRSLSNGTACSGYTFSQYAVRFRVQNAITTGFIFENSSEQLLMSINGSTKQVYMTGDLNINNLVGFVGNQFLYDVSVGTITLQKQYAGTGVHSMIDFRIATTNVSGPISRGRIEWNGTTMIYGNYSDSRLKENIIPIQNHYDILDKLNPINYKMIGSHITKYGFLAEELYKTYPQCVSGEPNKLDESGNPDYMMIDESGLISILTKCIKGNRQEIKNLKNKVNDLEILLKKVCEKINITV